MLVLFQIIGSWKHVRLYFIESPFGESPPPPPPFSAALVEDGCVSAALGFLGGSELRRFLGAPRELLWALGGSSATPLELWGAPWEVLGGSVGPLGCTWRPLGALLGSLVEALGRPSGALGCFGET